MNIIRIAFVTLLMQGTSTRPASPPPRASVEGVVVNSVTGQPVSGATVELTGIAGSRVESYTDTTSRDGAYSIKNVPPGADYAIVVTRGRAYLPAQYGQRRPSAPGQPLTLMPGAQLRNLKVELTPAGTISGRVLDRSGKPVRNVAVYAVTPGYRDGRWIDAPELSLNLPGTTNGQGEYSISGLPPGQYYVRARFQPQGNESYLAYYFPGSWDQQAAEPVDLPGGGEVRIADFVVALAAPRHVSGVVFNAVTGSQVRSAQVALVSLGPKSSALPRIGMTSSAGGSFDFKDVPPGAYLLTASVAEGATILSGSAAVEVGIRDAVNVTVRITAGFPITGRVTVEGRPPGADSSDLDKLAIKLQPVPASFAPSAASPSRGAFTLQGLTAWNYRVTLSPPLRNVYVKAIRFGNADVLRDGLRLAGQSPVELEILLAADSGEIDGILFDDDKQPLAYTRVILVPEPALRPYAEFYRVALTDATGSFQMQGLPPGDYKLFSWERAEDTAWMNPGFLRLYESRGVPVRLGADRREDIDVTVLPPWL